MCGFLIFFSSHANVCVVFMILCAISVGEKKIVTNLEPLVSSAPSHSAPCKLRFPPFSADFPQIFAQILPMELFTRN